MSLVDTDVVVWYLRGNPRAARALDALGTVSISAVTYMELVQGCRSQREADQLRDDLTARGMSILPISESISDLAVRLIERYALANGLKVADALIAATAVVYGQTLVTGNARHFRALDGLSLTRFEP